MPTGELGDPRRYYHKAQIEFGSEMHRRPCIIWDISHSGARISAETVSDLPDTFDVLLTDNGNVRRVCQVQSRFDNQLGVRLFKKAEHSVLSPSTVLTTELVD